MQHLTVKCPTCGKEVPWIKKEKWRPFCSERCRLMDLGAWASDKYAIPVEGDSEVPEGEQEDGKEDE